MRRGPPRALAARHQSVGLRGVHAVLHGFATVQERDILRAERAVQSLQHYVPSNEVPLAGDVEELERRSGKPQGMRRDARREVPVEEEG